MIYKIINLFLLMTLAVIYLYTFIVVIKSRFKSEEPHSNAFIIVFTAALISASVNLYGIADITSDALSFFLNQKSYFKAAVYSLSFFSAMWIFSLILFHSSFLVISTFTKEDEKIALEANNIELASLHAVVLVTLAFILSPALLSIATEFIPYPETPFSN